MGYPMTYQRVINRWNLKGDYGDIKLDLPRDYDTDKWLRSNIQGDLRRLEHDQRDWKHLEHYAQLAGIAIEQARIVLDAFFGGDF